MKRKFPFYEEAGDEGAAAGGAEGADKGTPVADKTPAKVPDKAPAKDVKADVGMGSSDVNKDESKGYWPEDWRDRASKGDEKLKSRFERYQSPEAALQALIATQNKLRDGELKPTLGKNATPEEIAAYRKDLGIPETPDKYDLGKDLNLADADKPLVDTILKNAHATNQTPDQVKANIKSMIEIRQAIAEQQAEQDKSIQATTEDELRSEWGTEFRRNINVIHGLLDSKLSPETKDLFLGGRLSDGTPIGSSTEVLKMLVGVALENNPLATVVPIGQNQAKGLEDRISEIEKVMREDRTEYNRNEKMQKELRDLYEAREKMTARKSA